MKTFRILPAAALLALAALASAHHETTRQGLPSLVAKPRLAHHEAQEAGPGRFVSTFPGGDFVLPVPTR